MFGLFVGSYDISLQYKAEKIILCKRYQRNSHIFLSGIQYHGGRSHGFLDTLRSKVSD